MYPMEDFGLPEETFQQMQVPSGTQSQQDGPKSGVLGCEGLEGAS